jgi:hypothetical protein
MSAPAVIDTIVIQTAMLSSIDGALASSDEGKQGGQGCFRSPGRFIGQPDMDEETEQHESDQQELV